MGCTRIFVRELGIRVEGLDPLGRALADVTTKRTRGILLLAKQRGIVWMVEAVHAKSTKWTLIPTE
jgi:hypothetical protein